MICYCHDIAETLLNNILLMTFDEVVVRFINPTNYIYRDRVKLNIMFLRFIKSLYQLKSKVMNCFII